MRERRAARHRPSCRPRHGAHGHGWHATPVRGACGRRAPDRAGTWDRGGDADARASRPLHPSRRPGPPLPCRPSACPVSTPGMKAPLACAGTGTVHARKGDCAHDLAPQPAFHLADPQDDCPAGNPDHQICRPTCRPRPGRSPWSAAKCTCGRGPGLMTVSSRPHTRGAGIGAGVGTRAARDEAAVLSVAGHLTDRDRELVRLVARHRVLTTEQLAALAFGNITTARHRLAVLVRLGLLRRFRPHLQTGSAPWHYVLGPVGAAMLGQEDRDKKKWLPQVRADRQLALERSQRVGHMTGASWFFVALARHAREHGGGELLRWDGEGEASDYLYARSRELGPRPDGLGVWGPDGTDIAVLLESDTGTEHLPQLVGKLTGYAEQAGTNTALTMPLLFCFPTARREQSARKALAATAASLDLQIATAALDPRVTCPACGPAWMPLHGGHAP